MTRPHAERVWALLLAGLAIAAAAPPATPDLSFQQALADHDGWGAARSLDRMIEQRLPPRAPGRPDPVLDRAFAAYAEVSGSDAVALPLVRRMAAAGTLTAGDHLRLMLATDAEGRGRSEEASAQFRGIVAAPDATAEDRALAAFGLARLALPDDPAGTTRALAADPATVPVDLRWEADLLRARAAGMAAGGDPRPLLTRALAEAADAPAQDAAIPRVTVDLAVAAGRAGDRSRLIATTSVDRGARASNGLQKLLAGNLPLCGTGGVGPDDLVIVEVAHRAAAGHPRAQLVWASRPGIAEPFLIAAGAGAPTVPDGRVAAFGLRCRTAPGEVAVRNTVEEDTAGWMTSLGAYPLNTSDDRDPGTLAAALAQREARYGASSVMLLPILFRTIEANSAAAGGDMTTAAPAMAATLNRVAAIVELNHGPPGLVLMWKAGALGAALAAHTIGEGEAIARAEALVGAAIAAHDLPVDLAYALSAGMAQAPKVSIEFRSALLRSALAALRAKLPPRDPRMLAMALNLRRLRLDAGDPAGAAQAIAGLGLAPDLCVLADPQPRYLTSDFPPDAYPGDLIQSDLRGDTQFEFDLDDAGFARHGRLLVTDPPYAFDAIVTARIPSVRYDPARFGGRPAPCRAADQAVRWQIPD